MRSARAASLACLFGLALAMACGSSHDAAAQPAPAPMSEARWRAFEEQRAGWVSELADTVLRDVARHDTRHAAFHGCLDWHSAVHAHYALLAASRITGRAELRRAVDASLTPGAIAEEERTLAANPRFEMPYGRAWLLRLALEDARVTGSARLDRIADLAAASLRAYYTEERASPMTPEYQNASWALRQLFEHYASRGNDDGVAFVRAAVERSFLAGFPEIRPDADAREWPEFFSRWGSWAHLLAATATRPELERWLAEHPASDAALRPLTAFSGAHHRGLNFARAWGLWSLFAALGERRYRDAAAEHIELGMAQHRRWKDDFLLGGQGPPGSRSVLSEGLAKRARSRRVAHPPVSGARLRERQLAYSHWVPQFGIYAIASTIEAETR